MNKCNFCGRPEKDAELLITGQNGYICSDCVRQCYEILKSMNLELEPEARRNKKDGQHHFNLKQVPKPTNVISRWPCITTTSVCVSHTTRAE